VFIKVGFTVLRVSYLREKARLTIEYFLCTLSEAVGNSLKKLGYEKVRLIVILSEAKDLGWAREILRRHSGRQGARGWHNGD
jgi:hypothetical protein